MIFHTLLATMIATSLPTEQRPPRVAVIGAGIAGLTAAYRLQQQGFDVHVYEARNRVGGRILSVFVKDTIAELGAQNIGDGGEAKHLQRLIEERALTTIATPLRLTHSFYTEGQLIPMHALYQEKEYDPIALKSAIDALARQARTLKEVFDGLLPSDDPLYKSLSVRMAAYEGAPIEQLSTRYAETLYHMLLGGISAAHQADKTLYELRTIRGGNSLLPQSLADSLGERVHLNMPLVRVSKDRLLFAQGKEAQADIVLLAIPCSVYSSIEFESGTVPHKTLDAIQQIRYGTNAKIALPFPLPPAKRTTLVSERTVFFFDAQREILTLYYTAEAGRFDAGTILDGFSQDWRVIEQGFQSDSPPYSAPECARDLPYVRYEGAVGYSWPNDPYVKGSYSYIAPGQEELLCATTTVKGETVRTLFAPIENRIYFAGEHASTLFDVPGTMEAAAESGEKAARMILQEVRACR